MRLQDAAAGSHAVEPCRLALSVEGGQGVSAPTKPDQASPGCLMLSSILVPEATRTMPGCTATGREGGESVCFAHAAPLKHGEPQVPMAGRPRHAQAVSAEARVNKPTASEVCLL